MAITPIKIKTVKGERLIGPGNPVFIVAEMSGNHHQSLVKAKEIIRAAAAAGADAIKIQTYTPDTITIDSDLEYFRIANGSNWSGQTLYQLYQKAYTPWEWQAELKQLAEQEGLLFFSTPFDPTAVDFLERINVALYKVASFEVVDTPLLEKVGQTGKPAIISRGMATLAEIETCIETLKNNGCPAVAVLHCVSSYPASLEEMNLSTIPYIMDQFQVVSGFSDHSLSEVADICAVALRASIIEKHLVIARSEGGPDANFSLEPPEFAAMVKRVREAEMAMGNVSIEPGKNESKNLIFRKSLFAVKDIKTGEALSPENIRSIRPGYGLPPQYYHEVMGKKAKVYIGRGTPLSRDLIE